jgi:two-component system sensor histidine kinase/response regulator
MGMDERAALDALYSYGILDTPPEQEFDELTALAARLFSAPVAMLGFFDERREWVKSAVGWNGKFLPRELSLAVMLGSGSDAAAVTDLASDPRFREHPLVSKPPHIRFYAGAPLHDTSGNAIGALSILDQKARPVGDLAVLRALAHQAMRLVELRRARTAAEEAESLRASLEESESRFRELFEHAEDLIVSVAPDGRLLHVNQAWLSATGYGSDEVRNQPISRFVAEDSRQAFQSGFSRIMESGESEFIETVFVTSGGSRITVEGGLKPQVIDGRSALARVIFRDITQRKRFEEELARARDAALEAARLKAQFLTNVTHEFRTPMNGILGMVDLLLATPLTAEQRDYALHARTAAEQLLSIVNNILHVSAVEAGSLAPTDSDFDLYRTVQRIVEVMKVATLGKDLQLDFKWDDQLPPVFHGQQSRIRQVLSNLLDNAMKFTEKGSVRVAVSLEKETPTHRIVRFEVTDTGIGISEENRLLLFERFSQIDAGMTRKYSGVGLGLSTARQLVELMGGQMDVISQPGKGSTFWFSLPFARQSAQTLPLASSDLEFKGKRVLLADQSPTSRQILRHYMETSWGMVVEEALSGAEAMAKLRSGAGRQEPYRVILYDAMADIDGIAFAREVKSDPMLVGTGLIFMSAVGDKTDVVAMRDAGIAAHLLKPAGQTELFDALTVSMARDAIRFDRPVEAPRVGQIPPAVPAQAKEGARLLLVEDNYLNLKLTTSQLAKMGYKVDSAANGKQALDALESADYDVLLMDCQMPIMDGYEATMEIRRREAAEGRHRYIIAMTANALTGDREKCLAAGMDDYLSKPTKADELSNALARYFQQRPQA